MNIGNCLIILLLAVLLNLAVYMVFRKYLYGKPDAGMKFLAVNISKDLVWLVISLMVIDKTRENFLFIVICFIAASILIYGSVIKLINKS
ncbi:MULTISPECIES: hypothetical protein [Chryseobacterium]|uniref:Cation:proton antiporter n=1 Tax=Chryseobacterium camelliae TaxID=1265445 RepID=A0ABU0TH32_9FLAO|nr:MULTISPECIES: hypothetical protein [Chryseobacterium]MDT3405830.1 hypothetical protein [Pseudacidovorax intermedius]MDQ1096364.1 hypothetical protein [Chryseobacterium camelliae]MDQ1100303.1 hypothetical protein [Chryseobacterium sp. SORGH_AS_1048]MDR6087646.1 hypothetical protein [Chryseobacterium sp. SORGH_AS_0909]MDR6132019.1 hypothetical protein [Chryseobacterium sp. SORGH_AS_1175]